MMRLPFVLLSVFLLDQTLAFGPHFSPCQNVWGLSQAAQSSLGGVVAVPSQSSNENDRRTFQTIVFLCVPRKRPPSTLYESSKDAETLSGSSGPVKIIIAGAPASGKGTQCEVIKEKYGVVHLSTGDMLRAAVAAKTEVGKKAKEYMDSGKLVPDEVIIGVVKDRLSEDDCQSQGWLLDGFPRTPAQAKALEESGVTADCFLFLDVPDEILVERVVGRRTDPETGKIYHMTFSPPKDKEIEERLVQRSDDTEEKVKVRLEQFHENVDAVKDSYTDISVTIEGNQAPTVVSDAIILAIESKVSGKAAA